MGIISKLKRALSENALVLGAQRAEDRAKAVFFTNPDNFTPVKFDRKDGQYFVEPKLGESELKRSVVYFGGGYFLLMAVRNSQHPTRTTGTTVLGILENKDAIPDERGIICGDSNGMVKIINSEMAKRVFERVGTDKGFIGPYRYLAGNSVSYGGRRI